MVTMASKRDYYEVLGVERVATDKEIADAYRKLAIKYPPGQEPRRRGGRSSASRRRPRPSRCSATPTSGRATIATAMPASTARRRRRTSPTSTTSSRPSAISSATACSATCSAGGAAAGVQQGGRRALRRHARPARSGPRRHQDHRIRAARSVRRLPRHAAPSPAPSRETCRYCGGRGQVIQSTGIFRVQTTCPSCHGAGSIVKDPCADVPRRRATCSRQGRARGADSRRRRRPDARAAARRGRAEPQRRPARRLLLLHHGQGASAVPARRAEPDRAACRSPTRRRRWGRRSKCPRSTGRARVEDSRRHAVGRGVQAARPRHARPAQPRQWATCWCKSTSRCRRS